VLSRQGMVSLDAGKSVGRPELSDIYLAKIAHQYVSFVEAGDRRAVQTLRYWLEQENVVVGLDAVRSQLAKAEKRGFLNRPKGMRGKVAGSLTDDAIEILATHPDRKKPLHAVKEVKGRK
jgi:ABC-type transport system involved in cytochrome c biogenesis ATPase subunit